MSTSGPTALLSVSDKTNIIEFAQGLIDKGFSILSSGGTFKCLQEQNIAATEVSEYTGFEEIMGGRVKTLHPKIHGGILGRRDQDEQVMAQQGIATIDLVCVNLYPFQNTIQKPDCTLEMAVENIDIGGPAMIRAAAKNHQWVCVVVEPCDYTMILDAMDNQGKLLLTTRQTLAQKAFAHTANYDQHIQDYLAQQLTNTAHKPVSDAAHLPQKLTIQGQKIQDLRYGENAHQAAAFYQWQGLAQQGTLAQAKLVQGKPLSYNNIADSDAALACVRELGGIACVIVKHANPCGAAIGSSALNAYNKAFATDPTAAFGGIIAFNTPLDIATAQAIVEQQFVEVIIAPAIADAALACLSQKVNLRVLITNEPNYEPKLEASRLNIKSVSGGLLVQQEDLPLIAPSVADFKVVSQRQPTTAEQADLHFAWSLVKYVKSNAIVFAKEQSSTGIGAGQMSRVFAAQIATQKAALENLSLQGTVVASDAFFPFRDGVDIVVAAGATAIIQPGGSVRDQEVIAAADEAGVAMIFTHTRHFRH